MLNASSSPISFVRPSRQRRFRAISVTDHSTEVAVKRARDYQKRGADALMLLPPFFLQPSPEAISHHIFSVLEAVDIPVMVQYAPGETGLAITPAQLAEVATRYPHAVFKIECNPPVDYTREFLQQAPQASVLNGYAGLYMLQMLEAGGKGVMPGCSFSEVYVQIYQHWQQGEKALHRNYISSYCRGSSADDTLRIHHSSGENDPTTPRDHRQRLLPSPWLVTDSARSSDDRQFHFNICSLN